MGMITKLIQTGMTSTDGKDYLITFKAFVKVILTKLDVSEMTNSQAKQSFIFGFRHTIQVSFLILFNSVVLYSLFTSTKHFALFFFFFFSFQ